MKLIYFLIICIFIGCSTPDERQAHWDSHFKYKVNEHVKILGGPQEGIIIKRDTQYGIFLTYREGVFYLVKWIDGTGKLQSEVFQEHEIGRP